MKSFIAISLLTIALNSNAQQSPFYRFILKGQPSPFDSAVVTRIDRYRQEGFKLKHADSLVNALNAEIAGMNIELNLADSINKVHEASDARLNSVVMRKDSTIHILTTGINKLLEKETKWYNDPKIWIITFLAIEAIRIFTSN